MKKLLLVAFATLGSVVSISAQLRKDGMPDMRYKSNKERYGGYYTPSVPSYTPTMPSYTPPPTNNYYRPDNVGYPDNSSQNYKNSQYFPNNMDGTPDRRYKSNRYRY